MSKMINVLDNQGQIKHTIEIDPTDSFTTLTSKTYLTLSV